MQSFLTVMKSLRGMGLLEFVEEYSENCIIVKPLKTWGAIGREGSKLMSGEWLVRKGAVCRKKGSSTCWFVSPTAMQDVLTSRAICREFTGKDGGYSVAGNARRVWQWAIEKDESPITWRSIMQGRDFGYHECEPGLYPDMWAVDIKAAYWNALWSLETRKWKQEIPGVLLPVRETPDEKKRLHDIRQALNDFKLMRNCVWGGALGGVEAGWCYEAGIKKDTSPYPGPNRGAATLVARCISEATQLQAFESNAVYAMTDCVVIHKETTPTLWDKWGLEWGVKGFGEADIRFRHAYRVGKDKIGLYSDYDTHVEAAPRPPLPDKLFMSSYMPW